MGSASSVGTSCIKGSLRASASSPKPTAMSTSAIGPGPRLGRSVLASLVCQKLNICHTTRQSKDDWQKPACSCLCLLCIYSRHCRIYCSHDEGTRPGASSVRAMGMPVRRWTSHLRPFPLYPQVYRYILRT